MWRPTVRDDIDAEVAFHMEMRVDEFMAAGLSREAAESKARALFGDVGAVSDGLMQLGKRRRRRIDVSELLFSVARDITSGARALRAQWMLSLAAIVTLSIGIGACVAIFSVVNAVLLRPLPYGHPDRLTVLTRNIRASGRTVDAVSGADVADIVAGGTLFDGVVAMSASTNTPFEFEGRAPEPVAYIGAMTNVFGVLEIPIVHGRNFNADDGRDASVSADSSRRVNRRVAILGYAFWQRRFHGDTSVIGTDIVGPWGPTRIIGIVSPRAELLFPPRFGIARVPDVWEALRPNFGAQTRSIAGWRAIARLKPGVSIDAARVQLDSISAAAADGLPQAQQVNAAALHLDAMDAQLVRGVRPALVALMGAVIFVLLIACANVASLLSIGAARRERELAVRAAIGGTAWRIIRQLLTENALLGGVATLIGLVLAKLALTFIIALTPAGVPRLDDVSLDGRVLAFTLLATSVTLLFGLVPALRAAHPDVARTLRATGRPGALGRTRSMRSLLIVTEVALAFVLMIGCGLMVRSFAALMNTSLGFDPNGIITFTLSNRNFRSPADRMTFVTRVRERLETIPGVSAATVATALPFTNRGTTAPWGTHTLLDDPSNALGDADLRAVFPGYFELMRIGVAEGRTFSAIDSVNHDEVIIDEDVARRAFAGESAIGKTIVTRILGRANQPFTVIGVVRRERHVSLTTNDRPLIYFAWATGAIEFGDWAIRTNQPVASVIGPIRAALADVSVELQSNTRAGGANARRVIVNNPQPLAALVDRVIAPTRFALVLITVFAVIAGVLTAIGLCGVLASSVRQRTSEIGVRVAFGAEPRDIFSLIIGEGLRLSAIGLAIGVVLALAATRAMTSMLVSVQPFDPLTFATMALVFVIIACLACWRPARRAMLLDPNVALREDNA
ncbi:MAG TPA: ABC transporter permease [Gemmatimonadaceae bacterium]|jgi:putative ABC transport system permease protein